MCCGILRAHGSLGGQAGWQSTLCRADTVGREKGRKGHKGQEGRGEYGVVGAMCCGILRTHSSLQVFCFCTMCCGISEDYGSLDAFFFCTMCFCIIPGRQPTLYPVPLSFSSFSSFSSFTLHTPCAPHKVLCQPALTCPQKKIAEHFTVLRFTRVIRKWVFRKACDK